MLLYLTVGEGSLGGPSANYPEKQEEKELKEPPLGMWTVSSVRAQGSRALRVTKDRVAEVHKWRVE